MAAVYAGTHRNGARGAIKMLHLELSLEPEIRQRFLREGYVANTIDHPGVVRALDDDVAEDGSVFLVLELLDGETLEQRWARMGQRLPPDEALCAIDPVLSVLTAAHAKGIIHRDLKPENIFLCVDGSVKLLDFGIARLREGAFKMTQTGMTMGTPAFMAPEQALGRSDDIGPWTDLWALGATLFTLVSGRYVHPAESPNAQLVASATRQAPSLSEVMPSAHHSLVRLVDVALKFAPNQRWASAEAMQHALREAYHALMGNPVQTAPKLVVPTEPERWAVGAARAARDPEEEDEAPSVRFHPLAKGAAVQEEEEDKTNLIAPAHFAAMAARQINATQPDPRPESSGSRPRPPEMSSSGIARTEPMRPSFDSLALSQPVPVASPHATPAASKPATTDATLVAAPVAPSRLTAMHVIAAVAVLGAGVVLTLLLFGRSPAKQDTEIFASTGSAAPSASQAPSAAPPVVVVSAVPASALPPDLSSGSLKVIARGGTCEVILADRSYGKTPTSFELPPGEHQVFCKPSGGQTLKMVARIRPGETSELVFALPRAVDPRDRRRLSNPLMHRPTAVARRRYPSIERLARLDSGALISSFLATNRPVVLSADSAAWRERWSLEAIAERYGRFDIETEDAHVVYVGERAHQMRPLSAVIDAVSVGHTSLRWKGLDFLARVPGMRADLAQRPPPHHAFLPACAHGLRDTLWIAPRGTMSSLHHDGDYDNLNLQIAGRKLFLLIPPPSHEALHFHGSAESPINPFVPDLERFPRFARVEPIEATLEPGEILFIPKYWWHCVYTVEPAVNLSTHFRWDGELSPWGVLRGAPLVHRALTAVAAAMKRRGLRRVADISRRAWVAAYERMVPRVVPQPRCELRDP